MLEQDFTHAYEQDFIHASVHVLHEAVVWPWQTSAQTLLQFELQEDPVQPPPELFDVSLQYAVQEELQEDPVQPPPELFDVSLQYAVQEELQEDPVQLLLFNKSSSLSHDKNNEGTDNPTKIGNPTLKLLRKNSRLLRISSLEILSAIL